MFDLDGIWESDKKLKIATGIGKSEVLAIFEDFKNELGAKHNLKDMVSKPGRTSKLKSAELFLMLMIFLRHYTTFELLSLLFGLDTSNVKRWIDSSFETLGNVLVKKNFAHLIALNQEKFSKSDLGNLEKSILMELNKISAAQQMQ